MEPQTSDACIALSAHERLIASLAEGSAHSMAETKALFVREYARLAEGAKVQAHLSTLAAANVRRQLRRAT